MYDVIGSPTSRAIRVLWMLEELGQPYRLQPEQPQSEIVRQHNPTGKVPILIEGDHKITDSTAILTYLADKHGALTAPTGTIARAQQDSVTQQILDEVEAALWTASRHSFILPKERRVPGIKDTLNWEYNRGIHNVMARRKGPYLMGDDFTIPDIVLTHCATWAKFAGFDTENTDLVPYIKHTRAREAFRRLVPKKG
ncbi:glutathione S-transferase family protein [Shimia sp. R10_1]|uniref:glutathione S-transferase family protein n=1 Tax=Shimia sp. R10_1 TaxID=2821095 RepID=UPI001ADAFC1A|nr:glutathione S-transferase family protein [Shimia sp. R10_1]MBO9472866.1 glutathione S-transferase family protein [Shimia sp. R10_1]